MGGGRLKFLGQELLESTLRSLENRMKGSDSKGQPGVTIAVSRIAFLLAKLQKLLWNPSSQEKHSKSSLCSRAMSGGMLHQRALMPMLT